MAKKKEGYKIGMHRFDGCTTHRMSDGTIYHNYTYTLTFNKSMEHTGKHKAIEQALDDYDLNKWQKLWKAIRNVFV